MPFQIEQNQKPESSIRLLVVDDEPNIRSPLARSLSLLGYDVTEAASGEEALDRLREDRYDLMLLDLLMPGIDGVTVMREAHRIQSDLLTIILTGNATLESAIAAIQTEATNYLLKPSSNWEIAAAIQGALTKGSRRNQLKKLKELIGEVAAVLDSSAETPAQTRQAAEARFLTVPPLHLDLERQQVINLQQASEPARLTRGEMTVLACLMTHPDQVFSCQELARIGWAYHITQSQAENMIRPCISRLRSKIELDRKKPTLIQTIRGRGYCFVPIQPVNYSD